MNKLKELFDKIDKDNNIDDDVYEDDEDKYKHIEGENIVIKNKKQQIHTNINHFDTIQKDLEKYKGTTTSYEKLKQEQEQQTPLPPTNNDSTRITKTNHRKQHIKPNSSSKSQMDKDDESYLKQLTQFTPSEIKKSQNGIKITIKEYVLLSSRLYCRH
jgi:hypothetical protein